MPIQIGIHPKCRYRHMGSGRHCVTEVRTKEGLRHLTSMGGGRSALGEAVAHTPPARRGARSTTRGYAPLESSGNGCLRQPMQTFFYCDSHKSQQRGRTPRVKCWSKLKKQTFSINFLAISSNFVFFHFVTKNF